MDSPDSAHAKAGRLEGNLRELGRVLVAYSGGVDSAYLAWVAHRVLGHDMLAVIADSASLARTHLADALAFAEEQGIPVEVIFTSELDRPEYARNDGQRCFQCKDELFTAMESLRAEKGFDTIAYGVNVDDQGDFRPGQQAAKLHHVAAPLLQAGLTKQDIRELARDCRFEVSTLDDLPARHHPRSVKAADGECAFAKLLWHLPDGIERFFAVANVDGKPHTVGRGNGVMLVVEED